MAGWLSDASQWLELVLNVLEAIAIIVSVVTFFYLLLNKFSIGLRKILSPLGLRFYHRIRLLIVCRKSQNSKRAFIEYALLKSQGVPLVMKDWTHLISSFKSFYSDNSQPVFIAKNCSVLNSSTFSSAVGRYFDYFSNDKVKRAFGIDENLCFILQIKIEEAYLMPTCLLNGLLTFFDENWEEFIQQYVSTAYSEDSDHVHKILSDELFYTFNWLLWGPSYELEYRNGLWGGLCQISYGDESISVPAIADTTKRTAANGEDVSVATRLRKLFIEKEASDKGRYGFLSTAIVRLYDEIPYYKTFEDEINPHNSYFYEKIKNDELPFGVKIENFYPIANYKSLKYYATAYTWLLFIEEANENDLFKPEKCVAFYEHTNIADKQTYNFLIESAIQKSLFHFRRLFTSGIYQERKYRFILAMNDRIAERAAQVYKEEMAKGTDFAEYLKTHISFEPKFTPETIFKGFDSFFERVNDLSAVEINFNDKESLSLLGQFYTDTYINVFPDKDERETFDNLLEYLKLSEENGGKDYLYHILLLKDNNGKVLGGAIFDYFIETNTAAIEFIAVKEQKQSAGHGTRIYGEILRILNNDAIKHGHVSVDDIFIEINSPESSKEGDPMKYLHFWNKLRFKKIDFNYIQPPLEDDKNEVRHLWLAHISPTYERTHFDNPNQEEICKHVVFNSLRQYLKHAFKIKDPDSNKQFKEMVDSIKGDHIPLAPIIKK